GMRRLQELEPGHRPFELASCLMGDLVVVVRGALKEPNSQPRHGGERTYVFALAAIVEGTSAQSERRLRLDRSQRQAEPQPRRHVRELWAGQTRQRLLHLGDTGRVGQGPGNETTGLDGRRLAFI